MLHEFSAVTGWGYSPLRIRRIGMLVELDGVVMRDGGWETDYQVALIPEGMRPSRRIELSTYIINTGQVSIGNTKDNPDLSTIYMGYTSYGSKQKTGIRGMWIAE